MPFLIDGHNLIGVMPGISLADLNDEQALIQHLAQYARKTRRAIVVYFDRGSLLAPQIANIPGVKFHFVRPPRTADDALRDHIDRLGREAPNWTVVSSDREVRSAARQAGARILDSPSFAKLLTSEPKDEPENEKPEPSLSPDEIKAWEMLFQDPDAPGQKKTS